MCVCVSWTWGSQRTILCSRFLPSIFTWVLGTELRVLGLSGKWFCLLHHLSGLVTLQLWALFFLDSCSSWTPLCRFKSTLFQANLLPSLLCHSSCLVNYLSALGVPTLRYPLGSAPFLHGVPDLAACPYDSWRVQLCSSHLVCYTVRPMTLVARPCVPSVSPAYGPASY